MTTRDEKPIRFGAVYYRRSAPPRRDWERDYEQAAKDGMTVFRHWFLWSAIEVEPGKFDWEPYDRQLELAAKYNIDTVVAEMSDHAPEWLYAKYPAARRLGADGKTFPNQMHSSCVAGGNHTMCIDNAPVREAAGRFLSELGAHCRDLPGMYAYDVWNECSLYGPDLLCFCPDTQERFRAWLKAKYKDLATLNAAWFRYSLTDWSQVELPRIPGNYPEFFDAIRFRAENQEEQYLFRMNTLRKADPDHLVISHGNAKDHTDISTCCGDDWRYAKYADKFGYTYWYYNNCSKLMAGDMIRSAVNGKEFWRAETIGYSDWERRGDKLPYDPRKDETAVPENIRLDAMASFAAGATGFMNPRYRPLLEGRLFHGYNWYAPDGSPTNRSRMVADIEQWCNAPAQRELWRAKPQRGEIGILLLEDSQSLCYSLFDDTDIYAACLKGAHDAFSDSCIQSDIIRLPQLDQYDAVYLPYPVALSDGDADAIKRWVANGGTLISEGCFGYFDDKGHALEWQLNRGFDEVFGCVQNEAHLGPDANTRLSLNSDTGRIRAGVYRQSYQPTSALPAGHYDDGDVAAVRNEYGKGRALLVGSMPGYGYFHQPDEPTRRWFRSLLGYAGKKSRVCVDGNTGLTARMWEDGEKRYLWLLNLSEHDQLAQVTLRDPAASVALYRGSDARLPDPHTLTVRIQNRDAAVLRLDR